MDTRFLRVMQALFVLFVHTSQVVVAANTEFGNASIICKERERQALLALKHDLSDTYGMLSSWTNESNHKECCKWEGVKCNNQTGHVVELNLALHFIKGIINPSLVELHHLTYLDLSGNNFTHSPIPKFIGSLTNLKYLSLSYVNVQGNIPREFGNLSYLEHLDLFGNFLEGEFPAHLCNLSKLVHLDLSRNFFSGKVPSNLGNLTNLLYLDLGVSNDYAYPNVLPNKPLRSDLVWLSHLKSLRSLTLDHVDLSSASNWLHQVANLSHLQELKLSDTNLHDSLSLSFSSVDIISSNLAIVDLSFNNLTSTVHKSFLDACSLLELYLSTNKLTGRLDEFISMSSHCVNKSLEMLDLSGNQFTRSVPNLSQFQYLKSLSLGSNRLNGTISESIWELSKLELLDVGHNYLQGVISEAHLSKLSKLGMLDLSFNALMVDVTSDWVPPFQLTWLNLASCKLGPHFPRWLQTQNRVYKLDISSNSITGPIPKWLWVLGDNLGFLNLSHNHISGKIANLPVKFPYFGNIDLSSNMLQGPIPSFLSGTSRLDLSKNKFTDASLLLCSNNTKYLSFLDLSNNQLTGKLPECWTHFDSLLFLNLADNYFYGNIPSSMGLLTNIQALHLGNNNFIGEIPLSLNNCRELRIFDAIQNNLSGSVASWIGDGPQKFRILSLRSNMLQGSMSSNICNLIELQLLDLSFNQISGSIPKCIHKLAALVSQASSNTTITYYFARDGNYFGPPSFSDSASVIWKGKEAIYQKTLGLLRSIDLSSNDFIGEIPNELMQLTALVSLNISRNKLSGEIPPTIGKLKSLDSLDLSRNQLSGKIPSQFSQLGFLGVLDLSYNNLSGEIPYITKLQSFDTYAYMGNPELCGAPLARCPMNQTNPLGAIDEDKKHNFISGFYISMILGFIIGFWIVCGSLVLKKSWRYAYFKFFDDLYDKLYVLLVISMANLCRRIRAIS